MKPTSLFSLVLTGALLAPLAVCAQTEPVTITLQPDVVRDIGGVRDFDRSQFITIHETFSVGELNEEELKYLTDELEVSFGRNGGSISWAAKSTPADPANPSMPNIAALKKKLAANRVKNQDDLAYKVPEHSKRTILCTHPEMMFAHEGNQHSKWGPTTMEAVAEFTAQFLKHGFTDAERPTHLEVFNEPFVKARKMGVKIEDMCEQHNVVAKRVRELNPDVKVGGYSAAWVELEMNNFGHWDRWQKTFMDIAGANMDFFSYHIYDGVNVMGNPRVRTGSNSEAIMDLVDSYSFIKFDVAKPILITEFGGIPKGGMESMPYSAQRSAEMLYAGVGQLFTFMDHPDRLERVIPFYLAKGNWTYGFKNEVEPGNANVFLLWRRLADGSYVKTDLVKFYRFFKGVNGQWRAGTSSNPDIRVQLLQDGNRLNLLMMNLESSSRDLQLSGLEALGSSNVRLRSLRTNCKFPTLKEQSLQGIPASLNLKGGEAVLLMIDLDAPLQTTGSIRETRVYSSEYLKDIVADQPIRFRFNDVPVGDGTAVLRLSPGRELGKQVLPASVRFNGTDLKIPDNWMGGDQAGRANFFGMLEISVPTSLLSAESQVEITYPDTGGKLAAAVLQVNQLQAGR